MSPMQRRTERLRFVLEDVERFTLLAESLGEICYRENSAS